MSNNSHKTVLVVEDEGEISDSMDAMLTRKGYHVLNAVDAEGALKIAEHSRPSLILTDLDLPTLEQLMEKLHAHETLKHMPVAVIDINHPQDVLPGLTILKSFEDLDALLSAQSDGDGAAQAQGDGAA